MNSFTISQGGIVFLAAMLTNNIILTRFLGLCSYFSLSRNFRTAVLMGISVMVVIILSSMVNYTIYRFVLLPDALLIKADLTFLTYLIFILVIAGLVQILEYLSKRFMPRMAWEFGPFLALITVNCAIMGVNLFMINPLLDMDFVQVVFYASGSGAGWLMVIAILAAIRNKIEKSGMVPEGLKGIGIDLMITGIMAMIFAGFTGMIDI